MAASVRPTPASPDGGHDRRAADAVPMIEVVRGPVVESRHRGIAAVVDGRGRLLGAWGDVERPVLPRSSVKPIQALPLVETGAAEAFRLGPDELALACASHGGELQHTERVAAWLERIGVGVGALRCGGRPPPRPEGAPAPACAGSGVTPLHDNCSGKHAAMLTTARHRGEPVAGYAAFEHPVQQRVLGTLEQMTGRDLGAAPRATDGCSIPTIAIPLGAVALAMARLADPAEVPARRAEAASRLCGAWGGRPQLVAGTGRFDTEVIAATGGAVLVKGGAEGVHAACLPALGLGLAVKIEDGAGRAAERALLALLIDLGALDAAAAGRLEPRLAAIIHSRRGEPVGRLRPAPGFP